MDIIVNMFFVVLYYLIIMYYQYFVGFMFHLLRSAAFCKKFIKAYLLHINLILFESNIFLLRYNCQTLNRISRYIFHLM